MPGDEIGVPHTILVGGDVLMAPRISNRIAQFGVIVLKQ
jgi:hypothetical protein